MKSVLSSKHIPGWHGRNGEKPEPPLEMGQRSDFHKALQEILLKKRFKNWNLVTKSTPKSCRVWKAKHQRTSSRHSSGFVIFVLLTLLVPINFYFRCWFYKPSNGEFLLIAIWVPINPIKGKLPSLVKINLSGQSLGWWRINPTLWAAGQGHGHGLEQNSFSFCSWRTAGARSCACTEKQIWKQQTEKPKELQDSWKTHFFPLLIMQKPSSILNREMLIPFTPQRLSGKMRLNPRGGEAERQKVPNK